MGLSPEERAKSSASCLISTSSDIIEPTSSRHELAQNVYSLRRGGYRIGATRAWPDLRATAVYVHTCSQRMSALFDTTSAVRQMTRILRASPSLSLRRFASCGASIHERRQYC